MDADTVKTSKCKIAFCSNVVQEIQIGDEIQKLSTFIISCGHINNTQT